MRIIFHKQFLKHYDRLPEKIRNKFDERLEMFMEDPFIFNLNNHGLSGKYEGCRSINVTGDIRAIFRVEKAGIIFIDIDNHNNLYK